MVVRFAIWWVNLDPTTGSEIAKKRPCVIISPDVLNKKLETVIVAPVTSRKRSYPTRVDVTIKNRSSQIALDQIRTVDKSRLEDFSGYIDSGTANQVCAVLQALFAF